MDICFKYLLKLYEYEFLKGNRLLREKFSKHHPSCSRSSLPTTEGIIRNLREEL